MLRCVLVVAFVANFATSVTSLRNVSLNYGSWSVGSSGLSNVSLSKANESGQMDRPFNQLLRQRNSRSQPDRMQRMNKLHQDLRSIVDNSTAWDSTSESELRRPSKPQSVQKLNETSASEPLFQEPGKTRSVKKNKVATSPAANVKAANVTRRKQPTLREAFNRPQEAEQINNATSTNRSDHNNHTDHNDQQSRSQKPEATLGTQRNRSTINGIMYPPTWALPNAACLDRSGRRCIDGNECAGTAQCSKDQWCLCPPGSCADGSVGACQKSGNRWLGAQLRFSPKMLPDAYLAMATDEASAPYVVNGWPDQMHSEAIWDLLVEPDSVSVLLATNWARDHWHGRFMDLNEGDSFAVLQRQPFDAVQTAFNLVLMPEGRVAFRHVRTGMYLYYDQNTRGISACMPPDCPAGAAEFIVHPKPNITSGPCFLCENPYRLALHEALAYAPSTFIRPLECWSR